MQNHFSSSSPNLLSPFFSKIAATSRLRSIYGEHFHHVHHLNKKSKTNYQSTTIIIVHKLQKSNKFHNCRHRYRMNNHHHHHRIAVFIFFNILLQQGLVHSHTVCIIGSGIGGASVAHFLRRYSDIHTIEKITVFERNDIVGGRMATVTIAGEIFEAGGSILHPKNYHVLNYTKYLNLRVKNPKEADDSLSLGIWDGHKFIYKTLNSNSKLPIVQRLVSIANSIRILFRYGVFSLFRMSSFVELSCCAEYGQDYKGCQHVRGA